MGWSKLGSIYSHRKGKRLITQHSNLLSPPMRIVKMLVAFALRLENRTYNLVKDNAGLFGFGMVLP